jgi:hypothetical protein
MPYTIKFDDYLDLTETINWPAVVAGIWVPPPSDGRSPGTPTFAGTITSGIKQLAILTFPALDGPPTDVSAMLISEPSFGDLYRVASGLSAANPAHVNGIAQAGPPLSQSDLDKFTSTIGSQTVAVPGSAQAAFGALSLGGFIPTSITVSAVRLMLPTSESADGTLTLSLTGTIAVSHWGLWTSHNGFTFSETVTLAPSGDPVDPARILAATSSNPAISWPFLGPILADSATPALEISVNQGIVSVVSQTLAGENPPQQLSPGTAISAKKPVIKPSGLILTLSVANINGPTSIPLENTIVPKVVGDDVPTAQKAMARARLLFEEQKGGSSPLLDVPTVRKTIPPPQTVVPQGTPVTCIVDYPENQL